MTAQEICTIFKLLVARETERRNNSFAQTERTKFDITENNIKQWRKQKEELHKGKSLRTAFYTPKKG